MLHMLGNMWSLGELTCGQITGPHSWYMLPKVTHVLNYLHKSQMSIHVMEGISGHLPITY